MANNLTGSSPIYNATGKFGASLSSGTGQVANFFPSTGTWTLESWVKTTVNALAVAAGSNNMGFIGCDATGKAIAHYGSGSAGTEVALNSAVTISDGAWHHLALVISASGGVLYVDGANAASSTTLIGTLNTQYTNAFGVRFFAGNSSPFTWGGEVDECAVFSTAKYTANFTPATTAYADSIANALALYHFENTLNDTAGVVTAATAVTLSGPSTGTVSAASSAFTVGANGSITGTVVVTPSDSAGGGTFVPTTVSISSATPTGTFTYTASSAGAKTISVTNNGSLTNPASVTYTAAAAGNNALVTANMLFSPYTWNLGTNTAKTINAGAYFKTIFGGTTCTLNFDMTNLVAPFPEILYRIDKYGAWFAVVVAASVVLTIPADTSVYAAAPGHLLEVIVKSTTESQSRWSPQATAVSLTGIILDTGKTLSTVPSQSVNMLYYGDSITEGVRTVNSTATNDTDRNDASLGWAYRSAELLGAEVGVVGFGFQGFSHIGSGNVPIFPSSYNLLYFGVSRSFTPAPDCIIINQGTNDSTTDITSAVTTTLNALLVATPQTTKIVVMRPFNGNAASFLQAGIAACTTPKRCVYIDTTGYFSTTNSSDALHPYGVENLTHIAPLVATAVRPYIVTASVKPTTTKTISVTLQNRAGTAQVNLTGLSWEWSDTLGVVIDSGTGATTNATGVFSITTVHTNLAAASVGYIKITNSNGTVNTTDVSGEFAVAVS